MKRIAPKTIPVVTPEPAIQQEESKPIEKLSKKDPLYYSKIGAISAARRKLKPTYFSDMARLSHANRGKENYKGGRKKKDAA